MLVWWWSTLPQGSWLTSRFVSVIVHLFVILCRSVSRDPIGLVKRVHEITFNKITWSLNYHPKQGTMRRDIPEHLHLFAVFDPQRNGWHFMIPGKSSSKQHPPPNRPLRLWWSFSYRRSRVSMGGTGTVPEGFASHCLSILNSWQLKKGETNENKKYSNHCKNDQVNINCTNNLFATKKCEDINQQIWKGTRWAPY